MDTLWCTHTMEYYLAINERIIDTCNNMYESQKQYAKWKKSVSKVPCCIISYIFMCLVTQSCFTLCDPTDYSPPGCSVHDFSRQEYWSGLPFPNPGHLPDPGIEPVSPALAGGLFTIVPPGKPWGVMYQWSKHSVLELSLVPSRKVTRDERLRMNEIQ